MADGDPAPAFACRRVRQRRALLALLDPYEPRSTPILVDVAALGLAPWRQRAWVVARDGRPAAVVVATRAAIDRWLARCVLLDPAAASTVAALIDASAAGAMTGAGSDVAPVHPHLRRAGPLSGLPWVVVEPGVRVLEQAPDDELVRRAGRADGRALRALYRGYELAIGETWWQERSAMRTLLRTRTVFVAEEDGQLVAAVMVGGPTSRYASIDRLTVLPSHRRRGLAWQLLAAVQRLADTCGVGATAAIAATNPMEASEELISPEWWLTVPLVPRQRFRGQDRLRAVADRLGAVRRRTPTFVRATDIDTPPR